MLQIQHHTISLNRDFYSMSPVFSNRWGWWGRCGRFGLREKRGKGPAMTGGSSALFLQPEQEPEHCSEHYSINCTPERKMAVGNYIPIAAVIDTDTLVTHVLLKSCLYEDKTKQPESHGLGVGRIRQFVYTHNRGF